ncbi:Uncharacterised protein [Moraxella lacunata]|uniref:Uncharacterized protein n=1 Tax=Moraxella lacunata TaxID=477 RepID=A0A378QKM3_MORLA|nr:Uncharacterised protein [Moraxella lacunata]
MLRHYVPYRIDNLEKYLFCPSNLSCVPYRIDNLENKEMLSGEIAEVPYRIDNLEMTLSFLE